MGADSERVLEITSVTPKAKCWLTRCQPAETPYLRLSAFICGFQDEAYHPRRTQKHEGFGLLHFK